MSHELITFGQLRIEPPLMLVNTITPEFLKQIRMEPVPVVFLDFPEKSNFGGYCNSTQLCQQGEIALDSRFIKSHATNPKSRPLAQIYLHECAHRLLPEGHCHDAAFFCLNLLLHLRAGEIDRCRLWESVKLYDLQDNIDFDNLKQTIAAFSWALKLALELRDSGQTAEECAAEIHQRYKSFLFWQDAAPAREEMARQKQSVASARLKNLEAQLHEARHTRALFFVFGGLAGAFFLAMILFWR